MNASDPIELAAVAEARAIAHTEVDEKKLVEQISAVEARLSSFQTPEQKVYPTEEELRTLRRVAGSISWITFSVAFVELCERFSYYGTAAVCEICETHHLSSPF